MQRSLIQTLVSASLDAACLVGRDLSLIHANASYLRLAGVKYRELQKFGPGGLCHSLFQMETCEGDDCVALRALKSGRPVRIDEVHSRRRDLRLIVVAVPVIEDDQVVAIIEQYRDVTAENRMQSNYKQLLDFQRRQNELLSREVRRQTERLEETNRELQDALRRVEQLACTDGLTQLINRRHFNEIFKRELDQLPYRNRKHALILLDLDFFKRINDRFGHLAGDRVLTQFADILKSCARSTDTVARLGGEEFSVLLPSTSGDEAIRYFERVQQRMLESNFPTTVSAGIATIPDHGVTGSELLDIADRALYAAKGAGRNRVVLAPIDQTTVQGYGT